MTVRRILFITAYDRPGYFRETMETWRKVRGFYDWDVVVRLEPSAFRKEHLETIAELDHPKLRVIENERVLGVLEHPYVGFNELFHLGFDFVVRAEDDLIVSDDILEYFEWASEHYQNDQEVAAVIGYSGDYGPEREVQRLSKFSPWVWGTWYDRWEMYIRPTWDHDYSTNNGSPFIESGWDWNLNSRVLPSLGKKCVFPLKSRVDNIGVWGVHGTPSNIQRATAFDYHNDSVSYVER